MTQTKTAGATDVVVEVENCQKYFPVTRGTLFRRVMGQVKAVDGISFEVHQGLTYSLVGESGCGKTTTARMILLVQKPTGRAIPLPPYSYAWVVRNSGQRRYRFMAGSQLRQFDYDKVEIGEELGSFEYVLTQDVLDRFRESVEDRDAAFPTIAVKHDGTAFHMVYEDDTGGVNAGNEVEFYNPPVPGKKIKVTGRIADKYWRRDKPYLVCEATAVDEDGRLLEKMRTYTMKKPDEVGKKWQPQS